MKKYEYKERVIIQFDDGSRINYSKKKYGLLLDRVVNQAMEEKRKIYNYYEIGDDTIKIYYWQQNTNSEKIIIIDKEDYDKIKNYYWQLNCNGYPQTRKNNQKVYLYRLLMDYYSLEKVIDHINHNPLDNRKKNLRVVTIAENNLNKKLRADVGITKRGSKYRITGLRGQETLCGTLTEARKQREYFISQKSSTTIP